MQSEVEKFLVSLTWVSALTYASVLAITALRDFTFYAIHNFYHRNVHRRMTPELWYKHLMRKDDDGQVFFYGETAKILANLALCAGYVYTTYERRLTQPIVVLNRALGIILAIDYLRELAVANRSVLSVLRFASFCQIFSYPSLFVAEGNNRFLNFTFLRAYSAYVSYRKLDKRIYFSSGTRKGYERFVQLAIQFSVLFFMLAGGYQLFEYPGDLFGSEFKSKEWDFFNSFWFIVVTLSTVGYGDFSPSTVQGRLFVVFMIIITINVFYNEVRDIMTETSQNTAGSGKFRTWRKGGHIIITGAPTLDELVYFMNEFYTIYSGSRLSNENMKIVVLLEKIRWDDEDWYLKLSKNGDLIGFVTLLVGDYDEKLSFERAGIENAAGIFILTSSCEREYLKNVSASDKDKRTTNIALSIRKIHSTIPIYSQTLLDISKIPIARALEHVHHEDVEEEDKFCGSRRPKMKRSTLDIYKHLVEHEKSCMPKELEEYKIELENLSECEGQDIESRHLCLQKLYTALLVANIKANGVGTLCTNMFFDFGLAEFESKKPWLAEYHSGAACKILPALFPESLNGAPLFKVLPLFFRRGIVVVGLKTSNCEKINVVADLSMQLVTGQVGLLLTYLDLDHLCITVRKIGHEYKENVDSELCKKFKYDHGKKDFWIDFPAKEYRTGLKIQSLENEKGNLEEEQRLITLSSFFHSITSNIPNAMDRQKAAIQKLNNHVIIALDFQSHSDVTDRLSLFLKILWKDDNTLDSMVKPNDFVVVIHPTFWKDRSCEDHVFFVKGSPSKKESWDEANLSNARAVITMADMNQSHSITDASTLYTLIMLDRNLREEQNIFICSEIVDEKSLRLFRVPRKRRKNQRLGAIGIIHAETIDTFEDIRRNSKEEKEISDEPCKPNRIALEKETFYSEKSDLFSATRYTSGELLVHSTSNSLLIREFMDPGFIEFMMTLCGAGETDPGQHIFLLQTPIHIFQEFGKSYLEYGIIFELLINLGVVPLGIYRSGDASVRLPKQPKRRKERGKIIKEEFQKQVGKSIPTGCCNASQSATPEPTPRNSLLSIESDYFDPDCAEPILQEKKKSENILPYVYTLPEPNTRVSQNDAVYVLGNASTAITSGFILHRVYNRQE